MRIFNAECSGASLLEEQFHFLLAKKIYPHTCSEANCDLPATWMDRQRERSFSKIEAARSFPLVLKLPNPH